MLETDTAAPTGLVYTIKLVFLPKDSVFRMGAGHQLLQLLHFNVKPFETVKFNATL